MSAPRFPVRFGFLLFAALLSVPASGALQVFTTYENVWTVPAPGGGGENYYGSEWGGTSYPAGTTFYQGSLEPSSTSGTPVLTSSSFGQPVPNTVFDFSIGQTLVPPAEAVTSLPPVGWQPRQAGDNTEAYYVSDNPQDAAIYLPSLGQVVAGVSGALEVRWRTDPNDPNATVDRVYNISGIPETRPNRIFWTENPYRGPPINLRVNQQEVYAVFHTNRIVTGPQFGEVELETSSGAVTNQVLQAGVLHDLTLNQLRATRVTGLALIEYYQDSNFTQSLGVTPVQVLRPEQKIIDVNIGDRLLPEDRFYGTDGLTAEIIAGRDSEKVHVHSPQAEDAPKRGFVFAQRENIVAPWEVEIFWKQTDFRGVEWPFESDWFIQRWAEDAPLYVVSGEGNLQAPIRIGDAGLVAEIPFQEVLGNAEVTPDGILATEPGRFLIKYSANDNIWFESVEAVNRTDDRFTLTPAAWDIGVELVPAEGQTTFRGDPLTLEFPGFLYPDTGTAYNTNLYRFPETPSAIYGVNALADNDLLEAWFSAPSRIADLPEPVYYPGDVRRVRLQWPAAAPQLVIASERGNLGDPLPGREAFTFPTGSEPSVYLQNDAGAAGYNPNEEHALFLNEQLFALRDDLNLSSSSSPFVLTEFTGEDAQGDPVTRMKVFEVVRTNAVYPAFGGDPLTVPILLQPPMPLAALPQAINVRNQVTGATGAPIDPASEHPVAFRDRKRQWWAKAADADGSSAGLNVLYYYAVQDGFAFPSLGAPIESGELIPWLSGAVDGTPIQYPYTLEWPENPPKMGLAQTLTTSPANSGLPNIQDQLSARIVFQQSVANGQGESAVLFDPTARRGTSQRDSLRTVQLDPNWFSIDRISEVELSEPGGSVVLDLRLVREPTSNLTLDFSGALPDSAHITVSPTELTFTPADYNQPHFLTITSVNDMDADGLYRHWLVGQATGGGTAPAPAATAIRIPLLQHDDDSDLAQEIMDVLEASGKAVRRTPGRTYTFSDVSPALGARLTFDPDQPDYQRLSLVGRNVSTLTGSYLLGNWIREADRQILLSLSDFLVTQPQKDAWTREVNRLPGGAMVLEGDGTPTDSLALTASSSGAQGTGFITLVFNNSENEDMVPPALPVSMSVIQVVPELFPGELAVLPADNPLDEKLTIRQQNDYASRVDEYEFEWRTLPPTDQGLQPSVPFGNWLLYEQGTGVDQITISGASLQTISDNYFVARYRPVDTGGPSGSQWSEWVTAFAPGWVQRAVNGINPYEQRFQDAVNNSINPAHTMIQLAGGPYNGPVALNPDAVSEAGLIEIYRTILERARDLSIEANLDYAPANAALVLAASRISDLYMLLGNEAYADAQDPTIGFGSDHVEYGQEATRLFAFMNQVPTLLDEELALLRGRDNTLAPSPEQGPVHNRLPWNFTRSIDGGEVAYALNYNIAGEGGSVSPSITVEDAARLFPMGHGDAWGHYLSAMNGYYALLRHPNFVWIPGVGAQLLGGSGNLVVNVDEADERKFAEAAAAKARAGAEIVNRTYRRFFTLDEGDAMFERYRDEDPDRAWGVSDWAARAGQSAYYDWATATSLLPPTASATERDWALSFTQDTSRVDTGTFLLTPFAGITVEAWLKRDTTVAPGWQTVWFSENVHPGDETYPLSLEMDEAGALRVRAVHETGTAEILSTVSLGAGWQHVAVYMDQISQTQQQLRILIDGVDRTPGSPLYLQDPLQSMSLTLGAQGTAASTFRGEIDDFRIWNRTFSAADIASRLNLHLTGRETGLVLWYPMLAGSGSTLFDQAGIRNAYALDTGWVVPEDTGSRPPQPPNAAGAVFKGILDLDRSSVTALTDLVSQAAYIQIQLDNADKGLNPMGLARDTIPFDLSPSDPGTHFDQVLDRARIALRNANVLFEQAVGSTRRLRQQFNANRDLSEDLAKAEQSFHNQLVEIYGYPYTDDIGPTGTYPEGYDGPDLVNYAYVDFEGLGLEQEIGLVQQVEVTNRSFEWVSNSPWQDWTFRFNETEASPQTYSLSEQGFLVKPTSWTGRRKAEGRLQFAYAEYLKSYYRLRDAATAYGDVQSGLQLDLLRLNRALSSSNQDYVRHRRLVTATQAAMALDFTVSTAELALEVYEKVSEATEKTTRAVLPSVGAGVAGLGPLYYAELSLGAPVEAKASVEDVVLLSAMNVLKLSASSANLAKDIIELENEDISTNNEFRSDLREMAEDLDSAMGDQDVALDKLRSALVDFQLREQEFRAILAEGERVIEERTLMRAQAGRRVQQQRYNDLAFRLFRDDRLSKYQQSFDLAARYVYLAAKAYDYETGLLSGDENQEAGNRFLEDIVRARSMGLLDSKGNPLPSDGAGDPGLADILARMSANWEVVKGRYGINNPQRVNSHVSLRTELFRLQLEDPLNEGDDAWRQVLTRHRVADLNRIPEYRRYCRPVSQDASVPEPGIVIPFSTSIQPGENLFGHPLAGGDHSFASSHAAARIQSAAVYFYEYDSQAMATQPQVYLVPVGDDTLRSPSDSAQLRSYRVVEQSLPVPYPVTPGDFDAPDWHPLVDTLPSGFTNIRRHASFQAFINNNEDQYRFPGTETTTGPYPAARLVGRSVWNSRWLLIIPGRTLLADPEEGLNRLIFGAGTGNGPEERTGNGIKDIRLYLDTTSLEGE